jgi:hypothetical protein
MDDDRFVCERCGFHTNYKKTILAHLQSPTVCRVKDGMNNIERKDLIDKMFPPRDESACHKCQWCDKLVSKCNYSKHKKICKMKPTVDSTEELHAKVKQLESKLKELQNNQQTSVTTNNNININNYIQLNNFGSESLEHLTQDFVKQCLLNNVTGMRNLIEKIHFSDEAPLNKTIKNKNIKEKLVYVIDNNQWVVKSAQEATSSMIRKGCNIANTCYLDDSNGVRQSDEELYDSKIQIFLLELLGRHGIDYIDLQRRILALIIEYT